jgi:DNA polymerase-3 subunit epsilon
MNFTAIDFETAKVNRNSICQVGITMVIDGVCVWVQSWLVQPPNNEYSDKNIEIHGINPEQTAHADTFDLIWPQIKPFLEGKTVVAHNGSFDFDVLAKTLSYYGIDYPCMTEVCTYKIYGKGLKQACIENGIELAGHHDAGSDSKACAELYLKYLKGGQ